MVVELFPNLQKRVRGKEFWECIARLVLAGADEVAVFSVLDPDGSKRAMYPRPDSFPNCFASSQPQPSTKSIAGTDPMPADTMSPDAWHPISDLHPKSAPEEM